MSNEVSYQFQMLVNNGSMKDQYSSGGLTANQATAAVLRNVQDILTSATALDLGGVVTPGWAMFQNLDLTNYVELGIYDGGIFYPFIKLKAGEQCMLRLTTASPVAQANLATVKLFYIIYAN